MDFFQTSGHLVRRASGLNSLILNYGAQGTTRGQSISDYPLPQEVFRVHQCVLFEKKLPIFLRIIGRKLKKFFAFLVDESTSSNVCLISEIPRELEVTFYQVT